MTQTFALELQGVIDGTVPSTKKDGRVSLASVRRSRATIRLAAQAVGDTVVLGDIPEGASFAYAVVNSDTALAGAQLTLGVAGAAAKYAPAFTVANTNAPAMVGATAAVASVLNTAPDRMILTIAGAALPNGGMLVIDLYYSMR